MKYLTNDELRLIRNDAMDYLAQEHLSFDAQIAADIAAKDLLAAERELTARGAPLVPPVRPLTAEQRLEMVLLAFRDDRRAIEAEFLLRHQAPSLLCW